MPGVYGDHAKPGGQNDKSLDHFFARKIARGEFTPVDNDLTMARVWRSSGEQNGDASLVKKADRREKRAGMLAAALAKLMGIDIVGWDSDEATEEVRAFYSSRAIDYAGRIAAAEALDAGIEIRGWETDAVA